MLGCFSKSFISLRSCRYCMITEGEIKVSRSLHNIYHRTPEAYNSHAEMNATDESFGRQYGVTGQSPLNELQYFHAADCFPPDMMHHLFESGLVSIVLDQLIGHYIRQGLFDMNYMRDQLRRFSFKGPDMTNKPEIAQNHDENFQMKQKASQLWCFMRVLPLSIGHLIPISDAKWEVFLAMIDMVNMICSPVSSDSFFFKTWLTTFTISIRGNFQMYNQNQRVIILSIIQKVL